MVPPIPLEALAVARWISNSLRAWNSLLPRLRFVTNSRDSTGKSRCLSAHSRRHACLVSSSKKAAVSTRWRQCRGLSKPVTGTLTTLVVQPEA